MTDESPVTDNTAEHRFELAIDGDDEIAAALYIATGTVEIGGARYSTGQMLVLGKGASQRVRRSNPM